MAQSNLPTITLQGTDAKSLQRGVEQLTQQISEIESTLRRINTEAEKLLESKRIAESDRERLAKQRNALRIAIRDIEDSE